MNQKKDIGHKQALAMLETLSEQVTRETRNREKAEKALKESQARYLFLSDNQPSMIWGSGTDKLCNYFNKVWLDFTGRTLEQEWGNGWAEGVHPDDLERCLKIYTEAFDLRQAFKMEYRLRKADGSYAWIFDHGIPQYSLDGEFLGYMGTCIDTSESKRLVESLRDQEERYHSMFESSRDAIMLLTEKGFFDCNARTLKLFGCKSKSEFIACHPSDLSPPFQTDGQDSASAANERIQTALKRGITQFNWIHRRKDGKDFPAEVTLSAFDYSGNRVLQAIVRDLSDWKEAEEDMLSKAMSLQLIKEASDAIKSAKDLDEVIRNCLRLVCRIIDWPIGHAYRLQSFDIASCKIQPSMSGDDASLVSTDLWHMDNPGKFQALKRIRDEASITESLGLPGRVLATGRPEGIFDMTRGPNLPGATSLANLGVRSGLAFPVFKGNTVVVILEFFSLKISAPDNNLLETMTIISGQITRLIQRIQTENELKRLKEVELLHAAVAENETRLNIVMNTVTEGIIIINDQGIMEFFNSSAEKLFGYTASEAMGRNVSLLIPEPDKNRHDEYIWRLINTSRKNIMDIGRDVEGQRKDGSTFPLHLVIKKMPVGGRHLFLCSIRDITEQKKAFDEILSLRAALETENSFLRGESLTDNQLVGESAAMQEIFQQIKLVAPSNTSVLIQGESGAGKELVAQAVHRQSPRSNHLLVKTNCSSIPRELFESEFFGHVKGAFTGASQNRTGRFELAHKGSIFLDEISELPLELQAKLLRVLQEGQFEKVGEGTMRQVDVRIIAATNRNLKEEVRTGRFRADLYYRLNVFPINIPPLRERIEDIDLIANHLLERIYKKLNYRRIPLKPEVLQRLKQYHWPGNVRELQNILERSVILTYNGLFELGVNLIDSVLGFASENPADNAPVTLPFPLSDTSSSGARLARTQSALPSTTLVSQGDVEQRNIEEYRRQNILAALQMTNWKVSGPRGAAELLRMKPTTLISRMQKLGIKKPR